MSDGIKVHKTTLLVMFGLLVAVVAGVYVIKSQPEPSSFQNTCAGQEGLCTAVQQPQAPQTIEPAPALRVGCGCGGGGLTCGAGAQAAAPDPSKAVLLNSTNALATGDVQDIYIKAKNDGTYDKAELTVNAGSPVRLHFTADPDAGCGRQMVIYGLNIKAKSLNGEENVVDFIPKQAGTYGYNCGMRMWRAGKLVVV
ncbi:MAG: cupredoxin domain-containing protein [Candidatus Micrarchaeota archaeon]